MRSGLRPVRTPWVRAQDARGLWRAHLVTGLTDRRVRVCLCLFALLGAMAVGVAVAVTRDPNPPFIAPPGATSDLDFYGHVVARVRAGASYYEAAHAELRWHGYPSRSVFNWRTPVYAWVFGALPDESCCRALLCVAVLVTLALNCSDMLCEVGLVPASIGGVFLIGATAWCVGRQDYLFTELWAGMFIILSLACLHRGWGALGVAFGLFALFFRELSVPYVLVALTSSWQGRRRGETMAWAAGFLAFIAFMVAHAQAVEARLTPADQPLLGGWVRFGGVQFILTTSQANVFLMCLPLWCTAVYVPLAVAGLMWWHTPDGQRVGATIAMYLAVFAVVGAPFNFYWGFLTAPLLALGIVHAPRALSDLLTTALKPAPAGACSDGKRGTERNVMEKS